MTTNDENLTEALGFLRAAMLGLALINVLLPTVNLFMPLAASGNERNLWSVLATVISPVMAPLFAVGILFDYIMSRVRAADADGALRARFVAIARIDLVVMAVTLLFWVPYFIWLL